MDCKINWTNRAWRTYLANIDYLQKAWTAKEISNFVLLVDKKITSLSKHPRIGNQRNKKYPNIRFTIVHKRIVLVYKHKPLKNEIDLLIFWNTYQHPRKLKAK
ncbi:MAG: type II toxin-antitoxin system RelE/ParE family toxin [Bacteroidota bacterium]|nr:type II toxin-antitoxin system RelE/ParE family toxin [Bacteroidota bacterium]